MYEKVWILGPYGIFESVGTVKENQFFPREAYIYSAVKEDGTCQDFLFYSTESEAIVAADKRRKHEIRSLVVQMQNIKQRLNYLESLKVECPKDWRYSIRPYVFNQQVFGDLDCLNNHSSKVLEINLKKDNKAEILIETEL